MSDFNQVVLVGRLGNDPEVRYAQSGTAVCSISLATSRRVKDQDGEWKPVTTWHRLKAFGKTAEYLGRTAKKGDSLFAEGRLEYWEAEGKRGKLMVAEIVIEHFNLQPLAGRPAGDAPAPTPSSHDIPPDFADDDLPF